MVTNAFGPELGEGIIVDQRDQLTIPQEKENEILAMGQEVPVHPLDPDEKHIPATLQFIQETGDPSGVARVHLQAHLAQRNMKAQAAMMQQMAQQQQGCAGARRCGAGPTARGAAAAAGRHARRAAIGARAARHDPPRSGRRCRRHPDAAEYVMTNGGIGHEAKPNGCAIWPRTGRAMRGSGREQLGVNL